ncbi:ferredoxin--NADP+ reductase [Prauserella sediminis]|uniref:ferredoxin--NADP(+) reductase n=1 Tax=Prauserella sediminis TaxID=577680 RepID=A0A839XT95_9PSEU|nr:FAD-dependent oxidoreductase [Prauserella sediminis]MBB3665249.1 ferredoxin--NADP+ reductase [Prauserella sediminis]
MPHVVTQSCCSDASCVLACPVNCIHPTPDEPDFTSAEMLYIDPATCVDCGACVSACPVDAIKPHTKLTDEEQDFLSINSDFYRSPREYPILAPVVPPLTVRDRPESLRVAVVGSGPAGMYAADEILTIPGARVNVFERLSQPYGLARWGVAPDHQRTRKVSDQFDRICDQEGLSLFCGVEIGKHLTHDELLTHHHAVVYAAGASSDRKLDIPGIDLPGTASATEFVAWYNGHPEFTDRTFDLSHRRAVVIGNGNVALDVARILTVDPDTLTETDISPAALRALRGSGIEEVVLAGRRGPAQSAFTLPELVGLRSTPGVELTARSEELDLADAMDHKLTALRGLSPAANTARRIELRYLLSPVRITGGAHVDGVEFERNELVDAADDVARVKSTGELEVMDAGLVLTSIGYRGTPLPGLPFDEAARVVPNERGRVLHPETGDASPGTFVTGWIKRGPSGFIGNNKSCALETVTELVADFNAGYLAAPATSSDELSTLAEQRRRVLTS